LQNVEVDVVTFPDSPSGRTRADSVLMAEKVRRETGLRVMPHICCRDKNAIAIRSTILGAKLNDIKDFLLLTGDPVPVLFRQTTKSVFNFDSIGMMNIVDGMNEEEFKDAPVTYGGAINHNRVNIDIEIDRVKRKMAAGASFFMTQPVFSYEQAQVVKKIKEETGAVILVGVMPLVSRRNAEFMKNEMTGIVIPDDIINRYDINMTREEGECCGIDIAREILSITDDFADGYYFSFPFNRVHMLQGILE
jgi:homocysteine S-methyltransferase